MYVTNEKYLQQRNNNKALAEKAKLIFFKKYFLMIYLFFCENNNRIIYQGCYAFKSPDFPGFSGPKIQYSTSKV